MCERARVKRGRVGGPSRMALFSASPRSRRLTRPGGGGGGGGPGTCRAQRAPDPRPLDVLCLAPFVGRRRSDAAAALCSAQPLLPARVRTVRRQCAPRGAPSSPLLVPFSPLLVTSSPVLSTVRSSRPSGVPAFRSACATGTTSALFSSASGPVRFSVGLRDGHNVCWTRRACSPRRPAFLGALSSRRRRRPSNTLFADTSARGGDRPGALSCTAHALSCMAHATQWSRRRRTG